MNAKVTAAPLSAAKSSVMRALLLLPFVVTLFASAPAYATNPGAPRAPEYRRQNVRTPGPLPCPERVTMEIQGISSWKLRALKSQRLQRVSRGEQSLRLAVLKGDEARTRQLVQMFASQAANGNGPWSRAADRMTALQISLDDAALADQPELIRLLIQYGAKPDYANEPLGAPAIFVAARCGNIAAMNALYAVGADLSAPLNPKAESPMAAQTAIEIAVEMRQNAAIVWLLHHGVRVCTKREVKRMRRFMAYSIVKRRLDDDVVRALQCTTGAISARG